MSHEPITVVASNGKRYVNTSWALGVTMALLISGVVGWAGWLQATVNSDHDKLIEVTVAVETLDTHLSEWRLEMREVLSVIVEDHQEFRMRYKDRGQ